MRPSVSTLRGFFYCKAQLVLYIHVNQKTINYVSNTTNRHLPRHYRITRPNQYHCSELTWWGTTPPLHLHQPKNNNYDSISTSSTKCTIRKTKRSNRKHLRGYDQLLQLPARRTQVLSEFDE